jgi:hypothetical protein
VLVRWLGRYVTVDCRELQIVAQLTVRSKALKLCLDAKRPEPHGGIARLG